MFKKMYNPPIAERFVVEEDAKLLQTSRPIENGGDGDYGESKPIGAFVIENESEDVSSCQIWHD
jgi:hypothetical protein